MNRELIEKNIPHYTLITERNPVEDENQTPQLENITITTSQKRNLSTTALY